MLGAPFEVVDQDVELVAQVVVEPVDAAGHDPGQQDAAEAGRRLGRQPKVAERHPPGRRDGARVADLQLGQQHSRRR